MVDRHYCVQKQTYEEKNMRQGREASLHIPNLKGQDELYVYFFLHPITKQLLYREHTRRWCERCLYV